MRKNISNAFGVWRIYDKLSLEEQRDVLHALNSEIQIYKKEEIKESKTYIKKIKFAFDNLCVVRGH